MLSEVDAIMDRYAMGVRRSLHVGKEHSAKPIGSASNLGHVGHGDRRESAIAGIELRLRCSCEYPSGGVNGSFGLTVACQ